MRLTTVLAPKGYGTQVCDLAFESEISEVTMYESKRIKKDAEAHLDVIDILTNSRKTKKFVEGLMVADFYDPKLFSFSTRHPESVFASAPPEEETYPLTRHTGEVYEEYWQFSQITVSLVFRVFLAAILVAYGIKEHYMPLIIAGLLFLPYHHFLVGMGIGLGTKDWKLTGRTILAYLLGTVLIIGAAMVIGLLTKEGIKFTQYTETNFKFNVLLSIAIGAAAGFASVDDAGRRELIGLAATAHLTVYPIWFGLKFIYGFKPEDKPWESLGMFAMDTLLIMIFALIVLKLMKMNGNGIKRFIKTFR